MRKSAMKRSSQSFNSPLTKNSGDIRTPIDSTPIGNVDVQGTAMCGLPGAVRTAEDILKLIADITNDDDEQPKEALLPKVPHASGVLKRPLASHSLHVSKRKAIVADGVDTYVDGNENQHSPSVDDDEEKSLTADEINALNSTGKVLPKQPLYFNTLFCKQSARKHKKWEGDAILCIKGSSATLKNMEGKEIARGIGYKIKEVTGLEEGSKFFIGGKECEIQSEVSEKDYLSGKCFTEAGA